MLALRRACSPYNVNAVALACVPEALADQEYVQPMYRKIIEGRARLERALQAGAVQHWPSQANFVLLRVGPTKEDAVAFVEQMRQRGILVRDRSADEGCAGCVRITLGRREHVTRLLQALGAVFEELGIAQGVSLL